MKDWVIVQSRLIKYGGLEKSFSACISKKRRKLAIGKARKNSEAIACSVFSRLLGRLRKKTHCQFKLKVKKFPFGSELRDFCLTYYGSGNFSLDLADI